MGGGCARVNNGGKKIKINIPKGGYEAANQELSFPEKVEKNRNKKSGLKEKREGDGENESKYEREEGRKGKPAPSKSTLKGGGRKDSQSKQTQ